MTDKITTLEDARTMKRAGLPLNTPVEHREFTRAYSENWLDLMAAQERFEAAMVEFLESTPTRARWKAVKRTFKRLEAEALRRVAFIDELGVDEGAILASFLSQRAMPYLDFWHGAIDAVDDGNVLTINPGDIPAWVD